MVWWDPFEEMRPMRRRMRHLLGPWETGLEREAALGKRLRPALLDIEDKEGELVATVELPGMDKKGIKVDVTADSICIRAERREEKEEKKRNYYYKERSYGGFYRSTPLPAEIDPKSVKATYKDGVLEIRMQKAAGARKKAVEVQIQ